MTLNNMNQEATDAIRNFEALYPFTIVAGAVVLAALLTSAFKNRKAQRSQP